MNPTTPTDTLETLEFTAIGQDANAAQGTQEPEAPALTNTQIISGALAMGRDVFCTFTDLQSPQRTLDNAKTDALGEAWGKVCDKRGYDLGGYLGDYVLEIGAIVVTFAIAKDVRAGVLAELAAREPVEAKTTEVTEPTTEYASAD